MKTNLAASEQMIWSVWKGLKESNLPICTKFQEGLRFEQFILELSLRTKTFFKKCFLRWAHPWDYLCLAGFRESIDIDLPLPCLESSVSLFLYIFLSFSSPSLPTTQKHHPPIMAQIIYIDYIHKFIPAN